MEEILHTWLPLIGAAFMACTSLMLALRALGLALQKIVEKTPARWDDTAVDYVIIFAEGGIKFLDSIGTLLKPLSAYKKKAGD